MNTLQRVSESKNSNAVPCDKTNAIEHAQQTGGTAPSFLRVSFLLKRCLNGLLDTWWTAVEKDDLGLICDGSADVISSYLTRLTLCFLSDNVYINNYFQNTHDMITFCDRSRRSVASWYVAPNRVYCWSLVAISLTDLVSFTGEIMVHMLWFMIRMR